MIILGYNWSKWISQKSILEADERECVTKTGLDIGHMQQDKFDWAAVLERNVPLTASTWNSSMEFQSPGKKKNFDTHWKAKFHASQQLEGELKEKSHLLEEILGLLKNLVIRMNEIFLCLACYSQKLQFVVQKSTQRQTQTL